MKKINKKDKQRIINSGLFDPDWYSREYPDVGISGMDPLKHYFQIGIHLGRSPHPLFDAVWYLEQNPDVAEAGLDPLTHYLRHGWKEGRSPSPRFDGEKYLAHHQDVKESGMNPLLHYIIYGKSELRPVNDIDTNPDRTKDNASKSNLFSINISKYESFRKHCDEDLEIFFSKYDFDKYLEIYADVRRSKINPVIHYFSSGKKEGRKLFFKDHFVESLNDNRLRSHEYNDYKKRSKKANNVIYFLNLDPDSQIHNPQELNSDYDYVYFGVKGKEVKDSVWQYKQSTFFIESVTLMKSYHCLNSDVLLPDYENKVWVCDANYLTKKIYIAIYYYTSKVSRELVVFGSPKCETTFKYDEYLGCDELGFIEGELQQAVIPNCVINNIERGTNILAKYWKYTLKYNLEICFPVSFLSLFNHDVITEDEYPSCISNDIFNYRNALLEYNNRSIRIPLPIEDFSQDFENVTVSVIVPVYNALDDVIECLQSLETTTYNNLEIIVADDCSEGSVRDWLHSYAINKAKVTVYSSEHNLGYTRNVNNAIIRSDSDYVVLLNSDTIVYGNWIEKMIIPGLVDSRVGIIGATSNAGGWQSVPHLRGEDNSLPEHLDIGKVNELLENNSTHPTYPTSDIVNGFCICIKREVFGKAGLFDIDSFPKGYGEEDDFCMRATMQGYRNVVATTVYIHHSKSKSFGHSSRVKLANEGRIILDRKYGKESYKLLTESIGNNPIFDSNRVYFKEIFSPNRTRKTLINEKVLRVTTEKLCIGKSSKKICVHLHLHFRSMLDYFTYFLAHIPYKFDLYISLNSGADDNLLKDKLTAIDNVVDVTIRVYENRGRDVFPFIDMISPVYANYDYILHLHSKKSGHNPAFGNKWLNHLVNGLLYNADYVENILRTMESQNLGIVYPPVLSELYPNYKWGDNRAAAEKYLVKIGVSVGSLELDKLEFPAGNMFWLKSEAFGKMFNYPVSLENFAEEPIPIDGTLAHTIERSLVFISLDSGFAHAAIEPKEVGFYANEIRMFEERTLDLEEIELRILTSIDQKTPFSLVRFYDGEGAFFKAEKWSEKFLNERMAYYFGESNYTLDDALFIKSGILQSLYQADLVGIPNLDIVDNIKDFMMAFTGGGIEKLPSIRRRYSDSVDCNSAWRILSSFEMVITSLVTDCAFTTKDIHYDMVKSGMIYRILDTLHEVSVITSMDVAPILEKIFNLKVNEIKIPKRALDVAVSGHTNHYPNAFEEILNILEGHTLNGQVYLVGAGPLGKIYCDTIKAQGGIAIDMGAIFDSWVNFHTRPEHCNEKNNFNKDLLLTTDNVRKLTIGAVSPKAEFSEQDLPKKEVNKYI